MYDFLFTDAFWMEALIATLIASTASIIAVIITGIQGNKKTNVLIEKLDAKQSHGKDNLSKEHTDLSKEHTSIIKNIEVISGHTVFLQEQKKMEKALKKALESKMSQKELDINQTVEHVTFLMKSVIVLQHENEKLKSKIIQLEAQNSNLAQANKVQRNNRENDYDYER